MVRDFQDKQVRPSGLHLIYLGVLGQPEPPHEAPPAPLHPVPGICLLLLFLAPLTADLEDPAVLHLHLHLFFVNPGEVGLEDVGFGCLLPVDAGGGESRGLRVPAPERSQWEGAVVEGEALEGVPDVQREGVVDAGPSVAEEGWDQRHSRYERKGKAFKQQQGRGGQFKNQNKNALKGQIMSTMASTRSIAGCEEPETTGLYRGRGRRRSNDLVASRKPEGLLVPVELFQKFLDRGETGSFPKLPSYLWRHASATPPRYLLSGNTLDSLLPPKPGPRMVLSSSLKPPCMDTSRSSTRMA
ncbi:hypothetical protein Taro_054398 [Colocasia esculenta]|uniref:Uncharacterized protein n=1 Tax=Colocasia esculenta TaxID=4460 RepID=A0A843XNE3_COLES|nr:hypothetical protein [Colocasia esculenta]